MQHKLAISVACSVGLHALLLLYWHNQQSHSQHEHISLQSHTDSLTEPVRIVLRRNSQNQTDPGEHPDDGRSDLSPANNTPPPLTAPATEITTTQQVVPDAPGENPDNSETLPAVIIDESLLTAEPVAPESSTPGIVPDRLSIRDQIQRFSPRILDPGTDSITCQQLKRMQGMPVACQPERYAATMTEGETNIATRTQERLASLLDGPEPVPTASESDLSDTGNRIQANRNLVSDQLQANQVRNSVMNQP